jgi:hypothetical protein
MVMSSETLGLLASWLVPTVVHPLHAAVQARVFGANARQGAKCRNFGRGLLSVKGLQASDVYGNNHVQCHQIWRYLERCVAINTSQTSASVEAFVTDRDTRYT